MTADERERREGWAHNNIALARAAANIRIAPALFFILYEFLTWCSRIPEPSFFLSTLILQAILSYQVSRFLMRVPRGAVPWRDSDGTLRQVLKDGPIQPTAMVTSGAQASARVRGTLTKPVVLVSQKTALAWRRDARLRDLQWAHESAHVALADSFVYYMFISALCIAGVGGIVLYVSFGAPGAAVMLSFPVFGMLGLVALVAVRSYVRIRELSADAMARIAFGSTANEELARLKPADRPPALLLVSHPSFEDRLKALDDPPALLQGLRFTYLSMGFLSSFTALSASFLLTKWMGAPIGTRIGLAGIGIVVGAIVARCMSFGLILRDRRETRNWITLLTVGELLFLAALRPNGLSNTQLALYAGATILLSRLFGRLCRGVALGGALFAFAIPDGDRVNYWALRVQSVVICIIVAALWLVPQWPRW